MTTSASISYSLQQQQPQYFYAMLSGRIPFVTVFRYMLGAGWTAPNEIYGNTYLKKGSPLQSVLVMAPPECNEFTFARQNLKLKRIRWVPLCGEQTTTHRHKTTDNRSVCTMNIEWRIEHKCWRIYICLRSFGHSSEYTSFFHDKRIYSRSAILPPVSIVHCSSHTMTYA